MQLDKTEQTYKAQLLKGIFKPSQHFPALGQADKMKGLALQVIFLSLVMGLLDAALSYIVISFQLQPYFPIRFIHLNEVGPKVEPSTLWIEGIDGVFSLPASLLIFAGIFLIFFRDVPFKKLFAIQAYVFTISAISSFINIITLSLTQRSTPFLSLGIIGDAFHAGPVMQTLLMNISLFLIWKIYIFIVALRQTSKKSKNYVIGTVILLHVIYISAVTLLMKLYLFVMNMVQLHF